MEEEVKEFLIRVAQTISMGLLWLLVNMTIGIYFGLAFFEIRPSFANYIYYVFFLISLGSLLLYFKKQWKDKM